MQASQEWINLGVPFKQLSADVLAALKAGGPGWQTRVSDAMREWLKNHPEGR